jgi:hypothetical protein
MSHINASSVSRAVIAALKVCASFADRVADIRATLPADVLADRTLCADALRPGVAKFHGIELVQKSTGRLVFPVDHAASDAARQDLSRLCRAVMGQTVRHTLTEEVEVPAHIAKLAAKLVAECNEYEGAAKLLATAIAQAKASMKV